MHVESQKNKKKNLVIFKCVPRFCRLLIITINYTNGGGAGRILTVLIYRLLYCINYNDDNERHSQTLLVIIIYHIVYIMYIVYLYI